MDRCRLCGHKEMVTILSNLRPDFREKYSLVKCKQCSFVSLAPLPDDHVLEKYYGRDYWQKENGRAPKYLNLFFSLRMSRVVRELKRLVPANGLLLDWGAGDGSFVRLLESHGFSIYGIDFYKKFQEEKRIYKATIHNAPFPPQYFDAIVCFHVLEHLKDPIASVKSAFELLKPGGIFMAEVPNISSFQYKLFGGKWQPLEVPTHVNHFNPTSLSKIFTDNVNSEVIKMSFFSHRVSPSAFLLSIFPFFIPKLVRRKYKGRYPTFLKIFYLLFQLAAYPMVLTEAYCKRGAIIRIYLRKRG